MEKCVVEVGDGHRLFEDICCGLLEDGLGEAVFGVSDGTRGEVRGAYSLIEEVTMEIEMPF